MRTLFVLAFLLARAAWACIFFYPSAETGPNFRVAIRDRGQPVAGLRLQLDGGKRTAITDRAGIAEFRDVPPGLHLLSTKNDDAVGFGENIEVKRSGPAGATIVLPWPSIAPIPIRSLNGIILYRSGRPTTGDEISLDLLDGISGKNLQSGRKTGGGAFDFAAVPPGLYFLRVNPQDFTGPGLIAVDLQPNAPTDHLELDLGWTDCGLLYTDRSQCTHGELHLDQLRGRVADPVGRSIRDAEVSLLNSAGTLVQMLHTDREGNFEWPAAEGKYELVIRKPGFASLREQVTIDPAQNGAAPSVLLVRMGIAGSCTVAGAR